MARRTLNSLLAAGALGVVGACSAFSPSVGYNVNSQGTIYSVLEDGRQIQVGRVRSAGSSQLDVTLNGTSYDVPRTSPVGQSLLGAQASDSGFTSAELPNGLSAQLLRFREESESSGGSSGSSSGGSSGSSSGGSSGGGCI